MELNLHARVASQAGRGHGESFFFQHTLRGFAVQSADGRARRFIGDRKDIGAAEELDLRLCPSYAERVQMLRKVANGKVDVAAARGSTYGGSAVRRESRQHGMAQRADAQPRNQECDSHTGTEHRAQNRGLT